MEESWRELANETILFKRKNSDYSEKILFKLLDKKKRFGQLNLFSWIKRTGGHLFHGFEQLFSFKSIVLETLVTIVTKTNGLTLPMHNFLSRTTDDVNDL